MPNNTPTPKELLSDKIIGDNIRKIRKEIGITQTTLGKGIGVSTQAIQKYEVGNGNIAFSRLWDIAQYTERDILDFYKGVI